MRSLARVALFGMAVVLAGAFAAPAADDPAALLKPVVPPAGQVRVRLPITPGFPQPVTFPAKLADGKQKSKQLDVRVALDCLPNPSYVTAKKLEDWNYEVPRGAKEIVIPEIQLSTVQLAAAKGSKGPTGTDTVVRLTNVRLTIVNAPGSTDNSIHTADLSLSYTTLFGSAERAMEPRLSFGDKFLEWTWPVTGTKRPGTSDQTAPDVTASKDEKLVPAYGAMITRNTPPVFAFASINGYDTYKTPEGKVMPVNVMVSSITNMTDGVYITLGLQRGCKVDMEQVAVGAKAVGVENKSELNPGKIKELRIALNIGPGLKTMKDIVIKDLPVVVDRNITDGYMHVGQRFMDTYFPDAVYAADGAGYKLHGRVNPDLLADPKTRKKP
jgi:hypothetical protein